MVGIYSKATDLIDTLDQALKRGEPMMDLGPRLMDTGLALMRQGSELVDRATGTLERCDRVLLRLESMLEGGDALLAVVRQNAALEQRKLELEIARLEQGR
jgi:hypothetical protein